MNITEKEIQAIRDNRLDELGKLTNRPDRINMLISTGWRNRGSGELSMQGDIRDCDGVDCFVYRPIVSFAAEVPGLSVDSAFNSSPEGSRCWTLWNADNTVFAGEKQQEKQQDEDEPEADIEITLPITLELGDEVDAPTMASLTKEEVKKKQSESVDWFNAQSPLPTDEQICQYLTENGWRKRTYGERCGNLDLYHGVAYSEYKSTLEPVDGVAGYGIATTGTIDRLSPLDAYCWTISPSALNPVAPTSQPSISQQIQTGKLENVTEHLLKSQGWRKRAEGEVVEIGDVIKSEKFCIANESVGKPVGHYASYKAWTLHAPKNKKTQATYLLKVECVNDGTPCNGYTCRVTRKWIDRFGPPVCPHCKQQMALK